MRRRRAGRGAAYIPGDGDVGESEKPAPDREKRERVGGGKPGADPADTRRLEVEVVGEVEGKSERGDEEGGHECGAVPLTESEHEEKDRD